MLLARRTDALKNVSDACISAHKEFGTQHGGKVAIVQVDVSDKTQVASIWDKVPAELRNIDVLGEHPFPHVVVSSC